MRIEMWGKSHIAIIQYFISLTGSTKEENTRCIFDKCFSWHWQVAHYSNTSTPSGTQQYMPPRHIIKGSAHTCLLNEHAEINIFCMSVSGRILSYSDAEELHPTTLAVWCDVMWNWHTKKVAFCQMYFKSNRVLISTCSGYSYLSRADLYQKRVPVAERSSVVMSCGQLIE